MIRSEGVYETYTQIYKILKKMIRKDYGKPCPAFYWDCVVCQKYLMLAFLDDCKYDMQENMIYQMMYDKTHTAKKNT